jgi:hypothetical protein
MKTYLLTSTKWHGEIELRYDDDGLLVGYGDRAELDDAQFRWFLTNMPSSLNDLQLLVKSTKTGCLTEAPPEEITFDMFWQRYDGAVNSSRKRTLAKWQRMSRAEQVKAFRYVGKYFRSIPQGVRKKYAETYLNAELWNINHLNFQQK